MAAKKSDDAIQQNGLPRVWSEAKLLGPASRTPLIGLVVTAIELSIGCGIAAMFHSSGSTSKYDARIAMLSGMDLKPLYAIPLIFYLTQSFAVFHAAIYRCLTPLNNPNQYISKVMNKNEPYVLLEEEGDAGKFNRAQRASANVQETAALVLSTALMGGFVYPYPMAGLFTAYCGARVLYMKMYTSDAEKRGPGFGLSQHLIFPTMVGLTILAAYKM